MFGSFSFSWPSVDSKSILKSVAIMFISTTSLFTTRLLGVHANEFEADLASTDETEDIISGLDAYVAVNEQILNPTIMQGELHSISLPTRSLVNNHDWIANLSVQLTDGSAAPDWLTIKAPKTWYETNTLYTFSRIPMKAFNTTTDFAQPIGDKLYMLIDARFKYPYIHPATLAISDKNGSTPAALHPITGVVDDTNTWLGWMLREAHFAITFGTKYISVFNLTNIHSPSTSNTRAYPFGPITEFSTILPAANQSITYVIDQPDHNTITVNTLDFSNLNNITQMVNYSIPLDGNGNNAYMKPTLCVNTLYYSQDYYSTFYALRSILYQFHRAPDGHLMPPSTFLNTSVISEALWPGDNYAMIMTDYHIDLDRARAYTVNSITQSGYGYKSLAVVVYHLLDKSIISHVKTQSDFYRFGNTYLAGDYLHLLLTQVVNDHDNPSVNTLYTLNIDNIPLMITNNLTLSNRTMHLVLVGQDQHYYKLPGCFLGDCSYEENPKHGIELIDITNPAQPTLACTIELEDVSGILLDQDLLSVTTVKDPENAKSTSLRLYKRDTRLWNKLFETSLPFSCSGLRLYNQYLYCADYNSEHLGLRTLRYGIGKWDLISTPFEINSGKFNFNLIIECANQWNIHYPFSLTVIKKLTAAYPLPVQSTGFDQNWNFQFPKTLFDTSDDFLLINPTISNPALSWIRPTYHPIKETLQTVRGISPVRLFEDGLMVGLLNQADSIVTFWQINSGSDSTFLAQLKVNNSDITFANRHGSVIYLISDNIKQIQVIDFSTQTAPKFISTWTGEQSPGAGLFQLYINPYADWMAMIESNIGGLGYFQITYLNRSDSANLFAIYSSDPHHGYKPPANAIGAGTIMYTRGITFATYYQSSLSTVILDVLNTVRPAPPTLIQRYTPSVSMPSNSVFFQPSEKWLFGWADTTLMAFDIRNPQDVSFAIMKDLIVDNTPLALNWIKPQDNMLLIGGFQNLDNFIGYIGIMDISDISHADWITYSRYDSTVNNGSDPCATLVKLSPYKLDGTTLLLTSPNESFYHTGLSNATFCAYEMGYSTLELSSDIVPLSNHELLKTDFIALNTHGNDFTIPFTLGLNNNPPVVSHPIGNHSVNINEPINLKVVEVFFDRDDDRLTLSANLMNGNDFPQWLNFLPDLQEFFGTPSQSDAGTLPITVYASDGYGGITFDAFYLIVNIPPTVAHTISAQVALVGEPFEYVFPSNTFSSTNSLTYTSAVIGAELLPRGLQFEAKTRRYYSNSSTLTSGTYDIQLIAKDPYHGQVSTAFKFTAVDAPKVTTSELDIDIYINNGNLNYKIPASVFIGGNRQPLQLAAHCIPHLSKACPINWLFFNPNTARFSGEPPHNSQGTYFLNVTATDPIVSSHFPHNGSVTTLVKLDVPNRAPIVEQAVPTLEAFIWKSFSFVIPVTLFTDPDGDALTIQISTAGKTALPAWLSYDAASRLLSGTPSLIPWQGDNLNLVVRATDPFGATTKSDFQILVSTSAVIKELAKWYGLSGTAMLVCWLIARGYRLHQLAQQKPRLAFLAPNKHEDIVIAPPQAAVDIDTLKKQMGNRYQAVKLCAQNTQTIEIKDRTQRFKAALLQYLDAASQHNLSTPLPNILMLVQDVLTVVINMGSEIKSSENVMPWLISARDLLNYILTNNDAQSGWVRQADKLQIETQLDELMTRSSARCDISDNILHHIALIREALRHLPDDDNWQYVGKSKKSFATHLAQMVAVPPYGAYSFWSEGERTVGSWYTKLLQLETMIESAGHDINVEHIELCQRTLNEENDWRFIYAVIDLLQTIALTDGIDEHVLDQIVTEGHRVGDVTLKGLSDLERFEDYLLNRVDCCCLDDRNGQVREKAHIAMDAIRDKYPGRFGGWKEVSFNGMEMTKYHQL